MIAALICAALALQAGYYALGNMKCANDAPILMSESGNGIFIGYYLLAAGYTALTVIALLLTAYLTANALYALKRGCQRIEDS